MGIHPTNIVKSADPIFNNLYKYIEKELIIVTGKTGLENLSSEEKNIFKKQLEIFDETNTKIIIHTPKKDKLNLFKEIKSIILEIINSKFVVIDMLI